MSERQPNDRLAQALADARLSRKAFARRIRELSQRRGRPIGCDHTSVSRWLAGTMPREATARLIVEILSERAGRTITLDDIGLSRSMSGDAEPAVPEAWELADVLTRTSISAEALDLMEHAALGYAEQYPFTPPNELLGLVSRQMARVQHAISHPQPLKDHRRCIVLVGVLSGLAGSLWFDLGSKHRSAGFFDLGEMTCREAENPDLTAWLLATRSVVPYFERHYGVAVELLTRAEEAALVRSSARRRAWITSLRARSAAAQGDRDQSLAAIDRARHHIDQATELPTGTDFFDEPRLEGVTGSTYMLLADTDRAVPLLSHALANRAGTDAKGRALLTLDLAQCHAGAREAEQAARLANDALDTARATLIGPIVTRARTLCAELTKWSDTGVLKALDARVTELSRE